MPSYVIATIGNVIIFWPLLAVAASGSVWVVGTTSARDYPITADAFQPTLAGGNDVVVSRLSSDGSTLEYSTFIGGSKADASTAAAVDSTGSLVVVGLTGSSDFPLAAPFQSALSGWGDAIVFKPLEHPHLPQGTGSVELGTAYLRDHCVQLPHSARRG